jgi:hypothetical protein
MPCLLYAVAGSASSGIDGSAAKKDAAFASPHVSDSEADVPTFGSEGGLCASPVPTDCGRDGPEHPLEKWSCSKAVAVNPAIPAAAPPKK